MISASNIRNGGGEGREYKVREKNEGGGGIKKRGVGRKKEVQRGDIHTEREGDICLISVK